MVAMKFYLNVHTVQEQLAVLAVTNFPKGEGKGTSLQYSCLENPMGGGAWWAAVYGVAQSQT